MTKERKIVILIPARLASTRFRKKVMHKLFGIPMIEHVRRRALDCGVTEKIIVASGDREILETVKHYGGEVKQTYRDHLSGTTRVAEAVEDIDCTHVILIQGDEPLIQKEHLKKLTAAINNNPDIDSWNSISDLHSEKELNDINVVKAALNEDGQIIYFFRKSPSYAEFYNQIKYIKKVQGLIAYKKNVLLEIANSSIPIIEKYESIEQLRIIVKGFKIFSVMQKNQVPSINTKEDLKLFYDYLEKNPNQYRLSHKLINAKINNFIKNKQNL